MKSEFQEQLRALLNRHSKESESNTPDWVLAEYLIKCLDGFNEAIKDRELYFERAEEKAT